jgi:hypothetical protein
MHGGSSPGGKLETPIGCIGILSSQALSRALVSQAFGLFVVDAE